MTINNSYFLVTWFAAFCYVGKLHNHLQALIRQGFDHMTMWLLYLHILLSYVTFSSYNIPDRGMFVTQGLHSTICYKKSQFGQF